MLNGVLPALITPFKDNKIDFKSLEVLIQKHLKAGVSGFVVLGTTAETPALTAAEKEEILKFATQVIDKKAKVIVGVGSNSTQTTLGNIETAVKYSPDMILVVTPYYNKPNLSGMIAHYQAAAKADVPIMLYHIPGRTGQKLSTKFFEVLLKEVPQIKAVKESDYDVAHIAEMAVTFGRDRLEYVCGNDDLWPVFLGLGGRALISAAGNTLAPAFVKVHQLFMQGKTQEAMDVFAAAYPLTAGSFFEVNPTCSKYILEKLNICSAEVRLPLGPVSKETAEKLDTILAHTDRTLLI